MRSLTTVWLLTLPELTRPALAFSNRQQEVIQQNGDFTYSTFNAVHHAMRQFGSSLEHNGMTMFFATVPSGTEFYHGTSSSPPITGLEWLAFEPEHALVFAHGIRSRPPHHESGPSKPPQMPLIDVNHGREAQHPMDRRDGTGYLHTYRTKRELRLLYIDGQSAAKSTRGTLDVQDIVLRNNTSSTSDNDPEKHPSGRPLGGPMNEQARAIDLCNLATNEWQGRVDGILRMEAGFEIILCSFADHLDFIGANSIPQIKNPEGKDPAEAFNYFHAVAARYDGIGGDRVALDFERMVSLFTYPDAIEIDEIARPRVVLRGNKAAAALAKVRADLTTVLTETGNTRGSFNWQSVTDMVVLRYADRIEYLASGELHTVAAIKAEIDRAMRPFTDDAHHSVELEARRCTHQLLPSSYEASTPAAEAITSVMQDICSTFAQARLSTSYKEALSSFRRLKDRLAWTTWKRCRGCGMHEFCRVPIWPVGIEEDFERPICANGSDMGRGEYWDGKEKPPRP
ncbi:hypothetical protein K431DRAFT_289211 [Polychaeton citri CBS 116435]|uniref:Uncharacterized protein n=1 Tax=Polychaeton citri CBS 116435 TaxID=1314669 RepID=A0A9P4PXD9_9PEZI|nr:hypothetical protein K431DRAFT_289211 [Polychaeton citri CBS 116435]